MNESRYGSLIALVGAIQLLLVFAVWTGVLLHPLSDSTWVSVNLQSSSFWLALSWGGILLTHLGLGIRSEYVTLSDEPKARTSHKLVVYSAVGVAVYGLLATILLSAVVVAH